MSSSAGNRTLSRTGVTLTSRAPTKRKVGHSGATEQYKHAFPLMTHTDFGYHDQSAKTDWVELGNYMPKRNKGTPPWWRGADTYSPLYCEQGRYEYQRYLMISRFPSEYKKYFTTFLHSIAGARSKAPHKLPQEALHWLLRMIVDNFNPQHVHYLTAMRVLMSHGEFDMARDTWRIMEREQTWPDDKCIAAYLEVCAHANEKEWAFEVWNRYCTEKRFLGEGEEDPKPVSRVPFTLNRDEMLYLPKWKKFFDHDPNLDVTDLNRFNTTREIYRWMATSMAASGETGLFGTFWTTLEHALLTTPTPVPESPNPISSPAPRWSATKDNKHISITPWRAAAHSGALGPRHTVVDEMAARFLTNEQFLARATADLLVFVASGKARRFDPAAPAGDTTAEMKFCDDLLARTMKALGPRLGSLDTRALFAAALQVRRCLGSAAQRSGAAVHERMGELLKLKAAAAADVVKARGATATKEELVGASVLEQAHEVMLGEVLAAFAAEAMNGSMMAAGGPEAATKLKGEDAPVISNAAALALARQFDPRAVAQKTAQLAKEMAMRPSLQWSAELHQHVITVLAYCGTMAAADYFTQNVMRKFRWGPGCFDPLYEEFRRCDDVELWAEKTKRMLVWSERYGVQLPELTKRRIEADYPTIGVEVRMLKDLAAIVYRDMAEKSHVADPTADLPNPVADQVNHALPFPDRDTGYPNEYGDIGQWRNPDSGVRGPKLYAPGMPAEEHRGYTAEWRENTAVVNSVKMPSPWDRKYAEYNRGKHPSYDMTYAGPFPEVFPTRMNFRKSTRWDFHNVENQSKYKMAGPF